MQNDRTPAENSMAAAFAAILRGDTAERDRLCRLAEAQQQREPYRRATKLLFEIDFFVDSKGVAMPSNSIFQATH